MMRLVTLLTLCVLVLPLTPGCGTVYQPGRNVRLDPGADVSDDEIGTAFGARPQLRRPIRLAYFAFDDERAAKLERTLAGIPGIESTYRIPALLTTGKRRFEEPPYEPQPLSLRRIRLHAARARCELLVIVDYGYRIERSPNAWVVLSVLLIPPLFTPFLDSNVESYMDAYVIDVRNGYLYGQLSSQEQGTRGGLTIWSDEEDHLIETQWTALLRETRETLAELMASPDAADLQMARDRAER